MPCTRPKDGCTTRFALGIPGVYTLVSSGKGHLLGERLKILDLRKQSEYGEPQFYKLVPTAAEV